jgi:DmsE family decaheme c-type cytochrome
VISFKTLSPRETAALCLNCHERRGQANWHGSMHDRRGVSCTDCHSVHYFKSSRSQLKTMNEPETCYSCHPTVRAEGFRTSHHPVREGRMDCSSCHNAHDSTNPKMLIRESVNDTCLSCHADKRGPFLWEHAPVRENCMHCHKAHGSNHERLLTSKQPYLCQRCHLNIRHPGTMYDNRNMARGAAPSNRAFNRSCVNCHNAVHGSNAPSGPYLGR